MLSILDCIFEAFLKCIFFFIMMRPVIQIFAVPTYNFVKPIIFFNLESLNPSMQSKHYIFVN